MKFIPATKPIIDEFIGTGKSVRAIAAVEDDKVFGVCGIY